MTNTTNALRDDQGKLAPFAVGATVHPEWMSANTVEVTRVYLRAGTWEFEYRGGNGLPISSICAGWVTRAQARDLTAGFFFDY